MDFWTSEGTLNDYLGWAWCLGRFVVHLRSFLFFGGDLNYRKMSHARSDIQKQNI